MKFTRFIAIGVIAASLGIHAAGAKTLANADGPAEIPPASFKGKQYVDSRGCVYIRAGIDGRVNWVPRVTRDRKVICGFRPTLGAASQVAAAAAPKPAQKPVQITLEPEPTAKPAPAPKPTPKPARVAVKEAPKPAPAVSQVAAPKPAAKPATKVSRPAPVAAPAPRPVVKKAKKPAKPAPAPSVQVAENGHGCSNFSRISAQLMQHSDYPVRCGPQAANPSAFTGRYNTRLPAVRGPALNGDTMNLQGEGVRHGPQDESPAQFKGRYNTRLPASPGPIRYQESMKRQDPALVRRRQVATNYRSGFTPTPQAQVGAAMPQIPPGYRPAWKDDRLNPYRAQSVKIVTQQAEQPAQRISTRSAPAQPSLKRDVIRASVQVGVYRDRASAQTIARKVRRMGLPVRIGILNRGNEELRLVLAGPFNTDSGLTAALGKVKRAGYGNAVIRR